ncbi:MAG: type VI secretion system-associated protein TagF [Sandarakinorhabdus sp.]|nr:type VI secretion system-associated protein TagF [Sandarakinorhabdus sp.]
MDDWTIGLYGKLPGRGDFVRHGWDDATVEALDTWLADGLAAWRPDDDAAFAAAFADVPLYTFYLPPGWMGDAALHGVLSPSVDRAGRYFFLVAGAAGPAAALWHVAVNNADFAAAAEAATYAALGPDSDPDALATALFAAAPTGLDTLSWRAALATPTDAIFWAEGEGAPLIIRGASPDAPLLAALLDAHLDDSNADQANPHRASSHPAYSHQAYSHEGGAL